MPDALFQSLSASDRRDALEVAAGLSGRRAHLLEKDIWLIQTLRALAGTPFRQESGLKGRHISGEGVSRDPAVFRRHRHYP